MFSTVYHEGWRVVDRVLYVMAMQARKISFFFLTSSKEDVGKTLEILKSDVDVSTYSIVHLPTRIKRFCPDFILAYLKHFAVDSETRC